MLLTSWLVAHAPRAELVFQIINGHGAQASVAYPRVVRRVRGEESGPWHSFWYPLDVVESVGWLASLPRGLGSAGNFAFGPRKAGVFNRGIVMDKQAREEKTRSKWQKRKCEKHCVDFMPVCFLGRWDMDFSVIAFWESLRRGDAVKYTCVPRTRYAGISELGPC